LEKYYSMTKKQQQTGIILSSNLYKRTPYPEYTPSATIPHTRETIGWLAIEAGSGTWNGHKYQASETSNSVTSGWYTQDFAASFTTVPHLVAPMMAAIPLARAAKP
jgi:hypothetical protein